MNGLAVCAGYDGIGLSVSLVCPEYRTVCYVEREAYAAAILAAKMGDGSLAPAPIWDDLGTFDGRRWRGVVDIVTAGLPCQPYSSAGKRLGHADERAIWPRFLEVVEAVRAPLVFLENVPPFLRHFQPIGERLSKMTARPGPPPDNCCAMRKVEPNERALDGKTAWISGMRRDQSKTRSDIGIVEWDTKFNLVKLNPLAAWDEKQVWGYIMANNVPYNELHDRGYPSIGCTNCTQPVKAGDDPRSGRWSGFDKTECGIQEGTLEVTTTRGGE